MLRNPLTHADIKNPHNMVTIAGIAYLSTEIDADITGGVVVSHIGIYLYRRLSYFGYYITIKPKQR